jgi:hypothetical protein
MKIERSWIGHIMMAVLIISALGGCSDSGSTQPGYAFIRYVGESYGGGVVFSVWKDASGTEHGLIVSTKNQSDSIIWSNVIDRKVGIGAQSAFDGKANTNAIIAQQGHINSAALLCEQYAADGQTDWYLPTQQELGVLWSNVLAVNAVLRGIPGAVVIGNEGFWSSVEDPTPNVNYAGKTYFGSGAPDVASKSSKYAVRAIRQF